MFARGCSNALFTKHYRNGAWSDWVNLEGTLMSSPAVSSWEPGRLDVFVQGTDGTLFERHFDNGVWSPYAHVGGDSVTFTYKPAAISRARGQIDVFVVGTDNFLYYKTYKANRSQRWSNWVRVNACFTSGVAVASWSSNSLYAFGRGIDLSLEVLQNADGKWLPAESLSGVVIDTPGAVSSEPRTLDALVRATNNDLYIRRFNR